MPVRGSGTLQVGIYLHDQRNIPSRRVSFSMVVLHRLLLILQPISCLSPSYPLFPCVYNRYLRHRRDDCVETTSKNDTTARLTSLRDWHNSAPTAVLLQTTTSQPKGQGWLRINKSRRACCGGWLSWHPPEITPSKSSKCMQKKCYAGRFLIRCTEEGMGAFQWIKWEQSYSSFGEGRHRSVITIREWTVAL
jgi:hypothetical protein